MVRTKPPKNGNGNGCKRDHPKSHQNMPRRLPNRWWLARHDYSRNGKAGMSPLFDTPEELWGACCKYFEWAEHNPVYESRAFQHKDDVQIKDVPKSRPFTQTALCRFLGVTNQCWWNYRNAKGPEFAKVCSTVDDIIYEQKFAGAAVGLYNPVIIARDLGLRDGMEVTGPAGGPIQIANLRLSLKDFNDEELLLVRKLLPDDLFKEDYGQEP